MVCMTPPMDVVLVRWWVCLHCTLEVLQPHFEGNVRMKLTLPKLGLGSPPGLPKFQNLIVGVKTPCIGVLFISLKNY